MTDLFLTFRFSGSTADAGLIQFYDASQALAGFERYVSLTNHLLLNGEVLTQSPSAKGFELLVAPPEQGSWKATVAVIFGAAMTVGVASKDSALGYLAVSALDYVLQQALGFDVNFDESLGPQIERAHDDDLIPMKLGEDRFDSLLEKVEPSLKQVHRPIVFSQTANNAQVDWQIGSENGQLEGYFNRDTYAYINNTIRKTDRLEFRGNVSSYNVNTFKGRLYIKELQRTIPFELGEQVRSRIDTSAVAGSLYETTSRDNLFKTEVLLRGFRNESVNGRLKSIFVTAVNPPEQPDERAAR